MRTEIAGKLASSPEAMIHWLRPSQTVVPGNGMSDQNLSEQEVGDAAGFLYMLK